MDAGTDSPRPLHEVFDAIPHAADPAALLAASGHEELSGDLLAEAILSYADTAPPEVAEHLSPVVLGAADDPALGLELLRTAPGVTWEDVGVHAPQDLDPQDLDDPQDLHEPQDMEGTAGIAGAEGIDEPHVDMPDDPFSLAFGSGESGGGDAGSGAPAADDRLAAEGVSADEPPEAGIPTDPAAASAPHVAAGPAGDSIADLTGDVVDESLAGALPGADDFDEVLAEDGWDGAWDVGGEG